MRAPKRQGNVAVYFLLFMGLTVPTMFMTINVWRIAEGKVQQQRFTDAAAHAAACELCREDGSPLYSALLYGDPGDISILCQTFCIDEAKAYAAMNFVDGVPLALVTTTVNQDVKFGMFDFDSSDPEFILIDPTTALTLDRRNINAVRVEAFRTVNRDNSVRLFGPKWTGFSDAQIVTRTTAALDRRVIGFRIQNNFEDPPVSLRYQKIPLAPIALLSEAAPPAMAAVVTSWPFNVEKDADPTSAMPAKIAYGNFTVTIPRGVGDYKDVVTVSPAPNSQLLKIGGVSIDFAAFNDQLLEGITSDQMGVYSATKSIVLDPSSFTVDAPSFDAPASSAMVGSDFQNLYDTFVAMQTDGVKRAWALTNTIDLNATDVTITGFVAARVIDVDLITDSEGKQVIQLELQPTLLNTPTAYTDYSNRYLKTRTPPDPLSGPPTDYDAYDRIINPYICRVRLVD